MRYLLYALLLLFILTEVITAVVTTWQRCVGSSVC